MLNFLKIFIILVFFFSGIFCCKIYLLADTEYLLTKEYIKNAYQLKTRKKTARISTATSNGRKIKSLIKKDSETWSEKGRKNVSVKKIRETGITTKKMVTNNRWFVKKPFQKSYTKISSIKRVKTIKKKPENNGKISVKASKMSLKRARETGPVKPKNIFPENSSRTALQMTKTMTQKASSAKPRPVYSKSSSRLVLKISKKRAKETGPVKPKTIYSEKDGRAAKKMIFTKKKKLIKIETNRKDPVYSADFLKSLGRIPPTKTRIYQNKISGMGQIPIGDNNTDS